MLESILTLKGATVLDKKQQAQINGGLTCTLNFVWAGQSMSHTSDNWPNEQTAADNCAALLSGGATSCGYSCSDDIP